MSINKIYKHSKSKNFTMLQNSFINDPNLSFKAKGIFLYFFSKPEGWDVKVDYTASILQDGTAAIYSGLKELEDNGYLQRKRFYVNGKVAGMNYHFSDDKHFEEMQDELYINQDSLHQENLNQVKLNEYIYSNTDNSNKEKNKDILKQNTILQTTEVFPDVRNMIKQDNPDFEILWNFYGKHGTKKQAESSFKKSIKTTDFQTIMKSVKNYLEYLESVRKNDYYPIKHLSTWLNQECFKEDWTAKIIKPINTINKLFYGESKNGNNSNDRQNNNCKTINEISGDNRQLATQSRVESTTKSISCNKGTERFNDF